MRETAGIHGFSPAPGGVVFAIAKHRSKWKNERDDSEKLVRHGPAVNKYGVFIKHGVFKKHHVFKKHGARERFGALVCLLGLSLFFAQCAGPDEPKRARAVRERIKRDLGGPELGNIGDKRHSVINPSRRRAEATGIGCGPSRADAIKSALRVSLFNLREVTGNARYRVEFKVIDEKPGVKEYCLEMSAKAKP